MILFAGSPDIFDGDGVSSQGLGGLSSLRPFREEEDYSELYHRKHKVSKPLDCIASV